MANKKITELTPNAVLADTDIMWKDTAGSLISHQITGAELKASLGGGFTSIVDDETNGNYAIGLNALDSITVGSGLDNIAIGENAGTAITTGDGNFLAGTDAGAALSTASRSVGIGFEALNDATGGSNTAIGYRAGDKISSGDTNLCLGNDSAGGLTTGSDNVIINRGAALTTGSGNIEIFTGTGSVPSGTSNYQIGIGHAGGGVYTGWKPIILGHMGASASEDVSNEILEITGPSARLNIATNPHGGDLCVQGGFASTTSAGVGGDLYLKGGAGGNTGTDGLVIMDNLPTSDPAVANALWNNSGVLTISAG
jgi:hypothetical protein